MKRTGWSRGKVALTVCIILVIFLGLLVALRQTESTGETGTTHNLQTVPGQVTGLIAEARDGGVKLSWDAVEGAEGYCIFRWHEDASEYRTYKFSEREGKTFSGLTNGQEYKFTVAAYIIRDHQELYGEFSEPVQVIPDGNQLKLSETFLCLDSGDTHLLQCLLNNQPQEGVTWTSSNSEAAIVDENGLITAVARGRATITAEKGGETLSCSVRVDRHAPERRANLASRYILGEDGVWSNGKTGDQATLMFTGDLMALGAQIKAALGEDNWYDFFPSFSRVSELFHQADLVVGNLETTLSQSFPYNSELSSYRGISNCNAPASYLDALKTAGFDLLTTANNHYCDAGPRGLLETLNHLDTYGFMHNGTYRNASEPRPVVVEVNGIKIGIITYNQKSPNGKDSMFTEQEQKEMLGKWYRSRAPQDIDVARELGAEFIVACIHYGTQNSVTLSDTQKDITQYLADCGADLIVGSHPHLLQEYGEVTAEDGRTVPVVYSMGNFCSSMAELTLNRYNIILNVELERRERKVAITGLSYTPCCILTQTTEGSYVITPTWQREGLTTEQQADLAVAQEVIAKTLGDGIASTLPENAA